MSAAGPVVFCRIDAPDLLATRPKDTGLHYFSFYQWVARRTLARVVSLPGGPSGEAFHLVIAGFGHFGQAVLRAALTDYFAKIAQISVVDKDAAELLEAFRFAAPAEWNGPLARAVARQQNLLNASLWKEFNVGASQLPIHIWVCTDNDRTNLTWAASLRRHVDQHVKCVIVCRQTEDAPESELSIHFASFETSDISGEIHDLLNASGA
jgi:hypothetical protein